MHNPRVAIICLAFNHSKYISETIDSFKNQKYKNINFFILDDASTDETFYLAKEAAKGDERIIVLQNPNNLGAALNSKKAIDMVTQDYDYIGFCEGDDYLINSNRISYQITFLEENQNASLVFTAAKIINESGNHIRTDSWGRENKKFSPRQVIQIGGNLCATASTLYRVDVIKSLPKNFYNYPVGDYPLQIWASFLGEVFYIPIIGAAYRQQSVSSWSRQMMSTQKYIENHKKTIEMLDDLNSLNSYQNSTAFSFAKMKYWYFFATNTKIQPKDRIDITIKTKSSPKLFIAIILLAPFFGKINSARRFFINKFVRGKL